jgi:WD40 repeat protein
MLLPTAIASSPSGLGYVGVFTPGQKNLDNTWSVALSPDGSVVATGTERSLVLMNMTDRSIISKVELVDTPTVLAFTPNGTYLVAGLLSASAQTVSIKVFEVDSMLSVGNDFTNGWNPKSIAISTDGTRVLIQDQNKGAFELSLPGLDILGQLKDSHDDTVSCVEYGKNDETLMTGGVDGKLILWDATDYSKISTIENHAESIKDCTISPDGEIISILDEKGVVRSYDTSGNSIQNSKLDFLEAIEIEWSVDGQFLFVLESFLSPSIHKIRASDWSFIEITQMHHKAIDFTISEDGQSIVVSTGTTHLAIYQSNYIPPGYGQEGADFDEDGVPDILDNDDDGDGISDSYDIHCPLDPIECALYPDEDYLRSVELNIEDGILQVHDTVSFSKYDSSALRNLTSTLLIDDRRITPEELTWMTGAMCDNIVSRDVVESWRVLLSLEGAELGEGEMSCGSVQGMSTASLDDYSARASLTWTTTFQLNGQPVAPYNITIKGMLEAPTGSSAVISAQFPVLISFSDSSAVDGSKIIWQRSNGFTTALMDAIPPDEPSIGSLIVAFISVNGWVGLAFVFSSVLFIGIMFKQKKEIQMKLLDSELQEKEEENEEEGKEELDDYYLETEEEEFEEEFEEEIEEEVWSNESQSTPPKPKRGPPRASTRRAAKVPIPAPVKAVKTRRRRVSSEQPKGSKKVSLREGADEEKFSDEDYNYGLDGVYHDPDWETDYGEVEMTTRVRKVIKHEPAEKPASKGRRKVKRKNKKESKKERVAKPKDTTPVKSQNDEDEDEDEDDAMDKALGMLTGNSPK